MIDAEIIGAEKFDQFIKEPLVEGSVDFFHAIKKNSLKTGIVKTKKVNKEVCVLKEDRQAFWPPDIEVNQQN